MLLQRVWSINKTNAVVAILDRGQSWLILASGALVLHVNGSPNNLVQSHFYTKILIAAVQPAEKYYCVPTEK